MKTFKLSLVLALVLLPMSAFAAVPWTGAPSTGEVDEASLGIFEYGTSSLGYLTGSTSTTTIVSRLNVTDTTASGLPGWTTMEIRAYDPSPNSEVRVKLVRLTAGGISTIATCTSSDNALITTSTCSLLNSVDFNSGYIYLVQMEISRTSSSVSPFITGVRLY